MTNAEIMWQAALPRLEKRLPKPIFSTFILPLVPLELSDRALTLQTFDGTIGELIRSNYGRTIEETLVELCASPLGIHIVTEENDSVALFRPEPELLVDRTSEASIPYTTASIASDISFPNIVSEGHPALRSFENENYPLNNRYTFDRFVRGKSNELSHAAALAVAESPGRAYNPLFIYGDVGLGKTHLMHAIGHTMRERNPSSRILYIPFEKFLNEFIQAIENTSTEQFRSRYREVDLLLVDDIQFIVGKIQTQDEFFHTFNSLYNTQKQIVISCDRPPREIQNLADRIRSRFEAGLIVDIQRPDLETRIAILQSKARDERINVSPEVYSYIATRITSNIRELEGALTRIKAKAQVEHQSQITLEYAKRALKEIIDATPHLVTIELVQQIVASFFGITVDDLKAKKRTQEIATARQIAMYFCRELTDFSFPKIGEAFGGRDHTTVMHAVDKVEESRKGNPVVANQLADLQRQLQA